jgi:indole-3-acetate monooxygenase
MAYGQARAFYFEATRQAWAEMRAGQHPSKLTVARLNLAQVGAAERSVEIVDAMYKAGGSASVYSRNTLDRRLRDIHTMAQHTVLGHRSLTGSGAALLERNG